MNNMYGKGHVFLTKEDLRDAIEKRTVSTI